MRKTVINGGYLTERISGIPRYANEVVRHLDKSAAGENIALYVPAETENDKLTEFNNIEIVRGEPKASGWNTRCCEKFAKKNGALYVNLCSQGVMYRNSISCLHDIRLLSWKREWELHAIKYYVNVYMLAYNSKKIATVSQTCKEEIKKQFGFAGEKICVIPNGWEHIKDIEADCGIFKKHPEIAAKQYYFSISSVAPHKNFGWVLETAKNYPERQFVISGRTYYDIHDFAEYKNVVFTDYISDGEMKALMMNAKALLFPSFYEGFGIPPLEALALGAEVISSNAASLPEVLGDAVYYIDPRDPEVDLEALLGEKIGGREEVLARHSWQKSAEILLGVMKNM